VTELGGDLAGARLAAVLQLTLPGLPFVYYGEELGMAGGKPDERIRTPMAWTLEGPHAGFTGGTPWQPLGADSLTANVAAHDQVRGSLLQLYRRLIHLRSAHPAVAEGTLIPLRSSDDAVVAFARRQGERVALVVANLGKSPARGVSLRSESAWLGPGTYRLEDLLTGVKGPSLEVEQGGVIRGFTPLPMVAARTANVFEVKPGGSGR
jgi:glycosidase